ncbi:MAG TPA: hypothetical protein VLE22_05865 [Bryobacteraceae bacterium]|nr:hypothetical protein [Bryobacteraceae bacterium]
MFSGRSFQRRRGQVFPLVTLSLLAMSGLAVAAEFTQAKASADSGGKLQVSWRETGLSPGLQYSYLVTATATATYWCVEGGTRHPTGTPRSAVNSAVWSTDAFTSSKAGTVSGEISLSPPGPTEACPVGQFLVLHDVIYDEIGLRNESTGASVSIPGAYSVLLFGKTIGAGKGLPIY